ALAPHNFQRRLVEAHCLSHGNSKFTNSDPAIFSRCSSKPEFHAESRLPLCRRLAAGWPVGPDKNQSLSLRTAKKFYSFRQFRYPPNPMPMCVKFSGSPTSNSLEKRNTISLSNGKQPPAITKSPRWTITVEPVRISSSCDEIPESERVFHAK